LETSLLAKAQPGALRPRPGQAVVSLTTPAVSLMFFTQFPELQEADISCPVIAGDATGMRWFNDKVLEKMVSFSRVMKEKNIEFNCLTYDEICERFQKNVFIYLDPPYFLTNGSYNDGKRGFSDWCVDAEFKFFNFVERLNCLGLNFMLSYVDEHKGIQNIRLQKWIKSNNFRMTRIDPFCGNGRKEILITNFEKNAPSTLRNKIKVPEKI
jgi:adenine-specific DNA-methyltransferase